MPNIESIFDVIQTNLDAVSTRETARSTFFSLNVKYT